MVAEKTAPKQPGRRGRPFLKGRSGNPRGRPPGARNAATVLAERLFDGEAEALTRMAIEKAKQGDIIALRLCLDRVIPPRRERPVRFALPALRNAGDAVAAMATLADGVANGEITETEATELLKFVENFVKVLEASDFNQRLSALENQARET
jgi:hypothetical protein